jgi:hypothetical protein
MTKDEYISRASKDSNVANALKNFQMWLGWYPADYSGATEFAGDMLETVSEVDEFQACVKGFLAIAAAEMLTVPAEANQRLKP